MPPINLTGLSPQAYEHPQDLAALNALEHTAGLRTLVGKVSAWGIERTLRIQHTGSFLHVTAAAFPSLHRIFLTARDRLDLPITPELYINNEETINAFTAGVERPIIVLHSGAVDRLHDDELLFLIAHEIGHIKSAHVLYYQLASLLPVIGNVVGDLTLGIGNVLTLGLEVALLHWKRTSELTADRAGLLACQDKDVALRAMMKLAGLPEKYAAQADVQHFIQQSKDFEALDVSVMDKVAKYMSIYGSSHPWTVMRAKELLKWIENGGYHHVLNSTHTPRLIPQPTRKFCDQCGREVAGRELFCKICGNPLNPPPTQ